MNEQALAPADYDYTDVLIQREHLSRQQRIACRSPVGIHMVAVQVGKDRQNTSTGETNASRGKMQRRRHETKGHSERGKVKEDRSKAKSTTSSPWNTHGERRLVRDCRGEDRESITRHRETKREDTAEQHYLKALLLKVWRAFTSVTEIAHLQNVKAVRHQQYCLMHRIWTNLIHHVACSRAHKTEQVERCVISLLKKDAWRRWTHHHCGLLNASYMVRRKRNTCSMSQHFTTWIKAWTNRAQQSAVVEHVATRRGQRAMKSRYFHSWKSALETSKQHMLLAEERFQMWQRVEHWLTPADSL